MINCMVKFYIQMTHYLSFAHSEVLHKFVQTILSHLHGEVLHTEVLHTTTLSQLHGDFLYWKPLTTTCTTHAEEGGHN